MRSVLCGIDESGSREAVTAAIDYCRANGTSLRLVGIVRDRLGDSTRGTAAERVRRSKSVSLELNRAAEATRAAGVPVSMILRAGNPMLALLREAAATDSGDVFYVRSRGLIRAAVTRQPRRELVHLSSTTPATRRLAAAA
jgi:hypothetical protein